MTDSVTDQLRADILAGEIPPGDRLVELSLCQRYDCGRAAIRDALVELTSEGLIEREANRGATVRRVSIEEAIEVTEARAALERLIATKAARRATDDQCEDLREIVARMRDAVAADDPVRYSGLNAELHGRLREISGHTIASHLVGNLRNRAVHHHFRLASMPGRPAESVEEHAAIVEAVVARDGERAAAAMEHHLQSAVEVLRRWRDI